MNGTPTCYQEIGFDLTLRQEAGKGLLRSTMMRNERRFCRTGMARLDLRCGGGLARVLMTGQKTGEI